MSNSRGICLTAERVTLRTVGGYSSPERALLYGYLSAAYFADGEEEWEDDEKEWSAAAVRWGDKKWILDNLTPDIDEFDERVFARMRSLAKEYVV